MTGAPVPEEAMVEETVSSAPFIVGIARQAALVGGLFMLALSFIIVVSVIGRGISGFSWARDLGIRSVPGDYELLEMATALAVFSFLPFSQAKRGNIIVDTFSGSWPAPLIRRVDGFYDLIYGSFMGTIGWMLLKGGQEAIVTGTNSMVLGVPLAPVFFLCSALCFLLTFVTLVTAYDCFKGAQ